MHASTTAETLVKIGSVVVAWQSLAYSPALVEVCMWIIKLT